MSIDAFNDPSRIRRTTGQRVRNVLIVVGCMAASTALAEFNGWINCREWWSKMWVQLRGGQHSLREKVQLGMTREEVKRNLWGEPEQPWSNTVISIRVPEGEPGPLPQYLSYPCPFARVDYLEYGFTVIYHGEPGEPSDKWKVIAVEDRP